MIILGINRSGHDGSVALLENNKVLMYVQEERLTNIKYSPFVFQAINSIKKYVDHVDIIALSGITPVDVPGDNGFNQNLDVYTACVSSLGKSFRQIGIKTYDFSNEHHKIHAATAFYNSGFETAVCVVRDGVGSFITWLDGVPYFEHLSVFTAQYPFDFELVERFGAARTLVTDNDTSKVRTWIDDTTFLHNSQTDGTVYELLSVQYGLGNLPGPGKLMGMSSYGQKDTVIESFYGLDDLVNKEFVHKKVDVRSSIFEGFLPTDFQTRANYAYKLQRELETTLIKHILLMIEKTGEKNVCLSGGVFLNCVANYKILKALPKDVKLYVEPMSNDAGNALGAAKYAYYLETQSTDILPQTTLYYGSKYAYTLKDLDQETIIENVNPKDIAQLLSFRHIIALYQGGAEAGPRALGNRSILYDPRDPNGKDYVNTVKNREWFRPFAGTVLKEKAKEWFDLDKLEESPFMMYAVDVLPIKVSQIPAITHVDNTCRIQTVTKEQNPIYYNLIKEFDAITGVPILFNTSFNLAGDAIVETLDDALKTMRESDIDYLYLPELNVLVKGRNK